MSGKLVERAIACSVNQSITKSIGQINLKFELHPTLGNLHQLASLSPQSWSPLSTYSTYSARQLVGVYCENVNFLPGEGLTFRSNPNFPTFGTIELKNHSIVAIAYIKVHQSCLVCFGKSMIYFWPQQNYSGENINGNFLCVAEQTPFPCQFFFRPMLSAQFWCFGNILQNNVLGTLHEG